MRQILALTLLLALSAAAAAQTVVGARLYVATTGDVIATFRGSTAAYSNDLFLFSPTSTYNGTVIFNNQGAAIGDTVNLGTFAAGTELIFRLHVNNTGNDFFSGDASRNPDGQAHARVTFGYSPTETLVEFEDLFNGPFSYNDLGFSFTNLQISSAPGPTAALPFALMALRRRKKAKIL